MNAFFDMLMYADDTTISCNINQNVNEIVINAELEKVNKWLCSNKLSLNIKKTKFMAFHHKQKQVQCPNIKINNIEINRVRQFNFLGIIMSADLKWKKHIDHISLKISAVIEMMYRLKDIYSKNSLLTLYNSLVVPHLNYCILTWVSKIVNGHKIHILQNKVLRIITDSDYIAHSDPICKECCLLKVTDMYQLTIWKFYFKLMNNLLIL